METSPGHVSQLKKEITSRSSPISHPDCSGGRLQWGILLLLPSQGFRRLRSDFLNSHPSSGQSPHQPEPVGFSHFFPPGWTAPCSRSLLTLQIRIQKHSSAPQPQSPSSLLQGGPGTSGRAIQIYIYILVYFIFCLEYFFVFVLLLFLTLSSECFFVLLFSPPLLPQSSLPFSEWCFLSHVGMFVLQNKKKGEKKRKKNLKKQTLKKKQEWK